jgi:ABC-2 type transport system ATP-binding protein
MQPRVREPGATPQTTGTTAPRVVEVSGLTKTYRSRKRGAIVAVDDVSFSVGRGEVVGLLGPNGAGKTTTIKCLCTLVTPTSGEILIDGVDAVRRPRAAVRNVAAVLEGNRNIYWRLTVRENVEFFAALHGIPPKSVAGLIRELIEQLGLSDKQDTPAQYLSRGMQQKVSVACAFVKQTPLLFLDEPTLGLDVETSYEIRQRLREMVSVSGQTILLSSHDMDVVQDVCERVIIINEGQVVTDDRVSNLLGLFKAKAYRFTIAGPLTQAQRDRLTGKFPMIRIEEDHETTIDVELLDGAGFYELVDILRSNNSPISSIDRRDPDLEEVFLRIIKGETRPPEGSVG